MSGNRQHLMKALQECGWHMAERNGTKHEIWHCGCGQHMVTIPRGSHGSDVLNAGNPILKRIRKCVTSAPVPVPAPTPRSVFGPNATHDPTGAPITPTIPAQRPEEPTMTTPNHAVTRMAVLIDGFPVITTEPATAPHPRWREDATKVYIPKGVVKALLDDGTPDGREMHLCTDCDFHAPEVVSVLSHRGSTHDRSTPARPRLDERTMKTILRTVETEKLAGIANHMVRAAEALNQRGLRTAQGKQWTPSILSSYYADHKGDHKIRVPRPAAAPPAKRHTPDAAYDRMLQIAATIRELSAEIVNLAEQVRATPDPVLVEKAGKYDEIVKRLLG